VFYALFMRVFRMFMQKVSYFTGQVSGDGVYLYIVVFERVLNNINYT